MYIHNISFSQDTNFEDFTILAIDFAKCRSNSSERYSGNGNGPSKIKIFALVAGYNDEISSLVEKVKKK